MTDLVITGGTVVDGTGDAPRTADLAVTDGVITDVAEAGALAGTNADRTIDADGLVVTPGFVDIHTHFDGQITWDPLLSPTCWHGVTTVVFGNCGVGFAPARPDQHDWLIGLMEGVEDIPGAALSEGIQWGWESYPEYLDAVDRVPKSLDVGSQIPHGAVRVYVTGARAGGGWRELDAWPPAGTGETHRWLGPERSLREAPPDTAGADGYRYDPANPTPSLGGPVLLARAPRFLNLLEMALTSSASQETDNGETDNG